LRNLNFWQQYRRQEGGEAGWNHIDKSHLFGEGAVFAIYYVTGSKEMED
jgi:hypothetical protein